MCIVPSKRSIVCKLPNERSSIYFFPNFVIFLNEIRYESTLIISVLFKLLPCSQKRFIKTKNVGTLGLHDGNETTCIFSMEKYIINYTHIHTQYPQRISAHSFAKEFHFCNISIRAFDMLVLLALVIISWCVPYRLNGCFRSVKK